MTLLQIIIAIIGFIVFYVMGWYAGVKMGFNIGVDGTIKALNETLKNEAMKHVDGEVAGDTITVTASVKEIKKAVISEHDWVRKSAENLD